jgi:hypothetical protein
VKRQRWDGAAQPDLKKGNAGGKTLHLPLVDECSRITKAPGASRLKEEKKLPFIEV